ncbi:MAG: TlpA disulfide reductase family protein [Pyrinomonadaceae bacterium]
MTKLLRSLVFAVFVLSLTALTGVSQSRASAPRTLFYDSDGNLVSNNEFVDIRMANPSYPDRTLMKSLEGGTVEFRLQKIPQEGSKAPEFLLKTIDGKTISSADLSGKVVVLNFWFIGCPVCRALKPKLNTFKTKFEGRDDVVFIAVTGDPPSDVRNFAKTEPLTYIQTAGAANELKKFVFNGYPKNIVISKTGEIVYWRTTVHAWDKFEAVVRGELAK